jgi:carbonic anhydrase/acetyltransferase-like protein (isoleucine patch superfamily)
MPGKWTLHGAMRLVSGRSGLLPSSRHLSRKESPMPLYALKDIAPRLDEPGSNWIAPDATIIGNVRLGRNVGIWFGAVLRGDNDPIVVGEGSNVQEHTVMHTDIGFPLTVGKGCTIGHRAMLHGCTIGDNSLIGMGAIVLNGARIGRNSLVGAGALVTEGKEFPDNSLIVGSPARAVRTLDEEAVERLRWSAAHYVENGKRFLADFRPA